MPVELLAPAGNLEKAKTAIRYGANAVYIGGKDFSLRSRASNFDLPDIAELVEFAHTHRAKVHVTVNILPHQEDLQGLDDYLLALDQMGVNAIIAASPYILLRAKELGCQFEKHVSTQHSSVNAGSVDFWQKQGMDRVVLGRECSLEEIEMIAEKTTLPIEVFIHGGMCISFSGRCVLSNHFTNRDANRGGCAQSCRWKYNLYQDGEDLTETGRPYSMSSRDLRAIRQIPALVKAGVASFKIEGRMKSAYYLATVVSTYRRIIDLVESGEEITEEMFQAFERELAKSENRPAGPGFLPGKPGPEMQLYRNHSETVTQEFVAEILHVNADGTCTLVTRNKVDFGQAHELFGPNIPTTPISFTEVKTLDGEPVEVCSHPMTILQARISGPVQKHAMIRKILGRDCVTMETVKASNDDEIK